MISLIDGDIVAYRCAATTNNGEPLDVALSRMDELLSRIIYETSNTQDYQLFIGGQGNWRKDIYPEYKAHRKDKPKPIHLNECLQYLRDKWNAVSEDGLEADDLMSIAQHQYGMDSVICSIDKDLLQVPGNHYNFVKDKHLIVSPLQGLRRFYGQIISGDGADNIPGFDGKIRHTIPKFIEAHIQQLDEYSEEEEMYYFCRDLFDNSANDFNGEIVSEVLHRNAQVLYMLKERDKFWEPPGMMQEKNPSL